MTNESIFPSLGDWAATKETLHLYSRAVEAIPRAHNSHPKWWHISLKVTDGGLITDEVALPDGSGLRLKMDMEAHQVLLSTGSGVRQSFNMSGGLTASALAEQLIAAAAELGLEGEYNREKFKNEEPREYDPAAAGRWWQAISHIDRIFKAHVARIEGETSPVQLWPHGFDLAVDWFGSRVVEYEEDGEVSQYPSQLNLGFSPGESSHPTPYFYSNPWPFEEDILLKQPLPAGARWFTEGWQGSIFPYAELAGDPGAEERLKGYARAVYEAAAPTLGG